MTIQLLMKFFLHFILIFLIVSCTSTNKRTESVSIVDTSPIKPAPTVIDSKNKTQEVKNRELKEFLDIIKLIEENFISQNCSEVLATARRLDSKNKKINLDVLPPLVQAAIYICDAKAGLDNPTRIQKAIYELNKLQLRYPIINEAWLHNTIADFYIALNDKPNAISEKKAARDLILAQQLDISSLNNQINQLSAPGSEFQQINHNELNLDIIATNALELYKDDEPEKAIVIIDAVPVPQRNDKLKRIRSDSVNAIISKLRITVRDLFIKSTQQTGATRRETLNQSKQILEGIINNYPEYKDLKSVQNNLKHIQRELDKP